MSTMQSTRRAKRMSTSRHQREAHKLLTSAHYRWIKTDANEHNHYHNQSHQIVVVVSSPRSESEALNRIKNTIRQHDRERQMSATPTHTVSKAQVYANMADPFLLKMPSDGRDAIRARYGAFCAWLKRVVEKHGPVRTTDLDDAAILIGFKGATVANARTAMGVVSYRTHDEDGHYWVAAMPSQVPDGVKIREQKPNPQTVSAVEPVMSDPNLSVPSPALLAAVNGTSPISESERELAVKVYGKGDEVSAAAQMLLETLGIKPPSAEALMYLGSAKAELEQARHAVDIATDAVAKALRALA